MKRVVQIDEAEWQRLRDIEAAYRLLVAADDGEVAEMPLHEWRQVMDRGRRAFDVETANDGR